MRRLALVVPDNDVPVICHEDLAPSTESLATTRVDEVSRGTLIDDELSSTGDVSVRIDRLGVRVLESRRGIRSAYSHQSEGLKGRITYIVAPINGRIPRAADSSTVSWTRTVGRLAGDLVKVHHAGLDGFQIAEVENIANHRFVGVPARLDGRSEGSAVVRDIEAKIRDVGRVDLLQFFHDVLDGACDVDGRTSRSSLNLPGELLDAIARNGRVVSVGNSGHGHSRENL